MTHWMLSPERKCHGEPIETFVTTGDADDEPPYPSPRARALCNGCQFRPDCLQFALDNDIDYGVWGGMSAYQREQISRKQSRKSCPACGNKDSIVQENNHEVCLGCGVSWPLW
jgi:WhiB family redox-sensing transcriptional regulator